MNKVVIDGVEYRPVNDKQGEIEIVILQRGHVAVGRFYREDNNCRLENCAIIRNWGTSKGLGELTSGPTQKTVLDKCGNLKFDYLTVVAEMSVEQSKWQNVL